MAVAKCGYMIRLGLSVPAHSPAFSGITHCPKVSKGLTINAVYESRAAYQIYGMIHAPGEEVATRMVERLSLAVSRLPHAAPPQVLTIVRTVSRWSSPAQIMEHGCFRCVGSNDQNLMVVSAPVVTMMFWSMGDVTRSISSYSVIQHLTLCTVLQQPTSPCPVNVYPDPISIHRHTEYRQNSPVANPPGRIPPSRYQQS
jgi:hypothetical protein